MAQFNRRLSAATIVQEALAIQGLPVPGAVAAGGDVTALQMWALLRTVGRRLCKPTSTHQWQVLKRTWVLDTDPLQTLYPLPADFDSFIDSTAWNFSSRLPMIGPATDSQWQQLKARSLGSSTISIVYRTRGDKLELYNTLPDVQALRIDYVSRAWVQLVSSTDPLNPDYADAPAEDGDIVLFDPELMVCAVQRAFMTAKGFDTSAVNGDYEQLLEQAIGADEDAPVLNASGRGNGYPFLTPSNLPDTGYGVP